MRWIRLPVVAALGGALVASSVPLSLAQQPKQAPSKQAPAARLQPHGDHATPEGWKFTWPKGDPGKGRTIFAKHECYACHEVKGKKFRAPTDKDKVGPELSMMGPLHEAEYFVAVLQRLAERAGADRPGRIPPSAEAAGGRPGPPRSLRLSPW